MTPRKIQILRIIRDSRTANGFAPTLQELATELGMSKVTVFEHISGLVKQGMLTRKRNRARSLELSKLAEAELPRELCPHCGGELN